MTPAFSRAMAPLMLTEPVKDLIATGEHGAFVSALSNASSVDELPGKWRSVVESAQSSLRSPPPVPVLKYNVHRLPTGQFGHPHGGIFPDQMPRVTLSSGTKVQCPGLAPGIWERNGRPWFSALLARECARRGYTREVASKITRDPKFLGPFAAKAETHEDAVAQLHRLSEDRFGHVHSPMDVAPNQKWNRADAEDAVSARRDELIQWALDHGAAQIAAAFKSLNDTAQARLKARTARKADLSAATVLDSSQTASTLAEALQQVYEAATDASYEAAAAAGADAEPTEETVTAIQQELEQRLPGIVETTQRQVEDVIAEGLRRAYSLRQIADGYEAERYAGVAGIFANAEAARAAMIAQTEAAHAFNRHELAALAASGVERVRVVDGVDSRDECLARNGRVVPINEAARMELLHPNCTLHFVPADSPDEDGEGVDVSDDGSET